LKNKYSLLSCLLIALTFIICRLNYTDSSKGNVLPVKVTTWDALGYYLYLPAQLIYHDEKELKWFPKIDSMYSLSGGQFYQANRHKNGNYVFKYLEGVSILQLPFFLVAHVIALNSQYPADGFSAPYQYAIAWGCIFYCLLAIFLLRKILLLYFSDLAVAISLILLILASNAIQYIAIEGGQSHGYIFPLYVFILYATIMWHQQKKKAWIFLIGFIIGLATICRPTEAVMLFIPLLWGIRTKKEFIEKCRFILQNKTQWLFLVLGGCLAILPQLLYWKRVTGSFVYDVGSKWDFLNPHFRVLFGGEKGWFIYTPITIFFVIGLFFMKDKIFKKSIITFCLLNIYIIIAWHIWRYGGSYSCRALVQSYPIFAFPLASFIEYILLKRWQLIMIPISIYLIGVNLFQIKQYNQNIIHYDDMNFAYYQSIYLNPKPSPLDLSLLDTKDRISNESNFDQRMVDHQTHEIELKNNTILFKNHFTNKTEKEVWYKFDIQLKLIGGIWDAYWVARLNDQETKIRLSNALTKEGEINRYSFFIRSKTMGSNSDLELKLLGNDNLKGVLVESEIHEFVKKE